VSQVLGGVPLTLVAARIEARPVRLPSDLAQPDAAALAGPEIHEHAAPLVVSRADAVEAVMSAGHCVPKTSGRLKSFVGQYENHPRTIARTGRMT
jgi:hypothetical protein